ncbi:hypothetical protein [Chryseobacterium sp. SIMBA_029]
MIHIFFIVNKKQWEDYEYQNKVLKAWQVQALFQKVQNHCG